MCDYSLMAVPNRLAQQGEELVMHRFPTASMGLASPEDVRRSTEPRPAVRQTIWQRIHALVDPPAAPEVCAVCIPPGARLLVRDIPARLQQLWSLRGEEECVFTQISANAHAYRDAVRFPGGREVRLQELPEGLSIRVLDLSGAPEPTLDTLEAQRALG
jgi:hypothetical protein